MGPKTNKASFPSVKSNITGLDKSFNLNLNTLLGVYSHKIYLTENSAGFGAKLTLKYSNCSDIDNFGWTGNSSSLRSINKKALGSLMKKNRKYGQHKNKQGFVIGRSSVVH